MYTEQVYESHVFPQAIELPIVFLLHSRQQLKVVGQGFQALRQSLQPFVNVHCLQF